MITLYSSPRGENNFVIPLSTNSCVKLMTVVGPDGSPARLNVSSVGLKPTEIPFQSRLGDKGCIHYNFGGSLMSLHSTGATDYNGPAYSDAYSSWCSCWGVFPFTDPVTRRQGFAYCEYQPFELNMINYDTNIQILGTWRSGSAEWFQELYPANAWTMEPSSTFYTVLFRRNGVLRVSETMRNPPHWTGHSYPYSRDDVPMPYGLDRCYQRLCFNSDIDWYLYYSSVTCPRVNVTLGDEMPTVDLTGLARHVNHFVAKGLEQARTELREKRSDCTQEICEQAQNISVNSIALVKELAELFFTLKNDPASLIPKLRTLADAAGIYLSYKYGARLTVRDLNAVTAALQKEVMNEIRYRISRSSFRTKIPVTIYGVATPIVHEEHYKCLYDALDKGLDNAIRQLYNWDLALSLDNVWDLIPYSFVVDWFVPLGDYLSQIDASVYYSTLPIIDVIYSMKDTVYLPDALISAYSTVTSGNVWCCKYLRSLSYDLPPILPHFSGAPEFHNFKEFTALLVQRLHK